VPWPDPSIDRITRSRRNPFTSVRLDRLTELRDDPEWVTETLASSAACLVPLWRNRNLLTTTDGDQQALYLSPAEVDLAHANQPPTLLGTDGKRYLFAVALNDRQRDVVLAENPAAQFLDLRLASLDMEVRHAAVLAYAKALLYWQYRNVFCGACGGPNRLESAGHKLVCRDEDCARQSFPRIDPAVIVLVTHGNACLLGHNASWPPRRFSTLAGFVEAGESLEDTVVREVFEESGVRLSEIRYVSSSDEMQELRWLTPDEIDTALAADDIRLPPPVSIAYRLIADWYQRTCGRDLEPLVRAAGSWRRRDG
jgi:NAD+ diphosphatase